MVDNERTRTSLDRLREWATRKGLPVLTVHRDGKWYMRVQVESPLAFEAKSGWEASPDAAAAKIVAELAEVGEQFQEG